MSGCFEFEHVKIFALVVDKVVHQLNHNSDLFGGGAKDGVLAEVDFVFISFEAVRGCYHNERMLGGRYWFGIFLIFDHLKAIYKLQIQKYMNLIL